MSRYELLSVAEAAREVGRARWFMYKEIEEKRIAVHKIGGQLAISRADLDDYIKPSRVAALGERKARRQTEAAK